MTEQPIRESLEFTQGWRIRRAMDEAGVSREDLASELGYAPNTISNWLHDKGPVRDLVLKQIALRCRVGYAWLKTGRPEGPPDEGSVQPVNSRSSDDHSAITAVDIESPLKAA